MRDGRVEIERQMMNWTEVRATMRLTRLGGHTHTHAIGSRVDPSQLEDEILICGERIEAETGVAPRFSAHPNSRPCYFTEEAKAALRRHRFEVAFTPIEDINGNDTDWMEVRRSSGRGAIPQQAWFRRHPPGAA